MTNEVIDYINDWYGKIYDGKSQLLTPDYFKLLYKYKCQIFINPDSFIFDTITNYIISTGVSSDRSREYCKYKRTLCDYLVDKNNSYHIYSDKTILSDNYDHDHNNHLIYIGNRSYDPYSIVLDSNIETISYNIEILPVIISIPVNVDHLYDSKHIDLQFLPNCIQDIIHQYSHDVVYSFIKMMLDTPNNIILDSNFEIKYDDRVISYTDFILHYRYLSIYCRNIVTDWVPLVIYRSNLFTNNGNSYILININENDYMYGVIIYSTYGIKTKTGIDYYRNLLIHCSDMIDEYNDYLINHELYKDLKDIKSVRSFIENIHLCKYAFEKVIKRNLSDKQLRDKLIAFTKK